MKKWAILSGFLLSVLAACSAHAQLQPSQAPNPNVLTTNPANPTGTTSTSAVAMGLGSACTIKTTPLVNKVYFAIYGTILNSTVADGAFVQLFYTNGAAPANAGSLAGTIAVGNSLGLTAEPGASQQFPFFIGGIVSSAITPNTTYVFDAGLRAVTGGTATIANLTCIAFEIP